MLRKNYFFIAFFEDPSCTKGTRQPDATFWKRISPYLSYEISFVAPSCFFGTPKWKPGRVIWQFAILNFKIADFELLCFKILNSEIYLFVKFCILKFWILDCWNYGVVFLFWFEFWNFKFCILKFRFLIVIF